MTHHMRSGLEFSTFDVMSAFKKFWIWEHLGFQIFQLGILHLVLRWWEKSKEGGGRKPTWKLFAWYTHRSVLYVWDFLLWMGNILLIVQVILLVWEKNEQASFLIFLATLKRFWKEKSLWQGNDYVFCLLRMDWSSFEPWLFPERHYHSLLSQQCQSMKQHPCGVMCPDAHPHTGIFGEFSPVLDITTLLSTICLRTFGHMKLYFKIIHHDKVRVIGERKRDWDYGINCLCLIMFSFFCRHTHTHIVHTCYILDFSFLRFLLRAVCCQLISLHLFYEKVHRGADSTARLAWFGSSLLFLRQSHLCQGRAVDTQLRLLTQNLCHVGGSGKDFLCEG